jgi:hypothetical protein
MKTIDPSRPKYGTDLESLLPIRSDRSAMKCSDDFLPLAPHTLSNLHSLTADDSAVLRSDFGPILGIDTATRCMANWTVYQAQSEADGQPLGAESHATQAPGSR